MQNGDYCQRQKDTAEHSGRGRRRVLARNEMRRNEMFDLDDSTTVTEIGTTGTV
jgi:hypothetical protein